VSNDGDIFTFSGRDKVTWVWDSPLGYIEDEGVYRISGNEMIIFWVGEDYDETLRFSRRGSSIIIEGMEYRRR
jgi:hypothetical protein